MHLVSRVLWPYHKVKRVFRVAFMNRGPECDALILLIGIWIVSCILTYIVITDMYRTE